jgi:glycosyltransferase involved in cell wall biosynthesis
MMTTQRMTVTPYTKFTVSMLIPGMAVDANTLSHRSLGGSESAGLYMARALAREGALVECYCNTANTWTDEVGVRYHPHAEWSFFVRSTPHDVCIVQRNSEALAGPTAARLNILWCHDLALGRAERTFRSSVWNIDRVFVLSDFMRAQYQSVYGFDDDLYFVTRNGVDLTLFDALAREGISRQRTKLIFAARPERGLDVLLKDVLPRLCAARSDLTFFVAGYDHHPEEWEELYTDCRQMASRYGDRVVQLGSLSKPDLYRHYFSGRAYLYPTPSPALRGFREISCISAMECQAAGLPIVSSSLGALSETVAPGAGLLVEPPGEGPTAADEYAESFSRAVLRYVDDDVAWYAASRAGLTQSLSLDWSSVAREWLAEFERVLRSRNSSGARLMRHLWRSSDLVAARFALAARDDDRPISDDVRSKVEHLLDASSSGGSPYSDNEGRGGAAHSDPEASTRALVEREPHFPFLVDWLRERSGTSKEILTWGGVAWTCALDLAAELPDVSICGVDTGAQSLTDARAEASRRGLSKRVGLLPSGGQDVGDHGYDSRPFDCAILEEVLEDAPQPWSILERVEQRVRLGGAVYLKVPFGQWAQAPSGRAPERRQMWQFDEHDLRDMLGAKPDLTIDSLFWRFNAFTGDPQGWWIVRYLADHQHIPPIDLARHLWLQRPRETLSVAIMAGPGSEDTLHWMLRSVRDVADEIVVADCGVGLEARRILSQYEIRLVPGVNPQGAGFDAPRNLVLDACSEDWCLWIDTDEKLVGHTALGKYLRSNQFHAYGLPHHHFACDTPVTRDLPCRLFRRLPYRGKYVRFHGAIHEHPELALNVGPGPHIVLPDVHVAHVGYLDEDTRRRRFARNLPLLRLDQERYPDRRLQKHFLMRDKMHLVRYGLEQTGGRVTDSMRQLCRETVALYREHFLGRKGPPGSDSLEYYSDALTVLGEGFEAAFQLSADKTRAHAKGVERYRFASADDLRALLNQMVIDTASRFDSTSW